MTKIDHKILVVHRSSETSTKQSDIIVRFNDRFFNLVVDSDSQCQNNICLTLFFGGFLGVFFGPHTDKHLAVLSQRTSDTQSIHIFGLVYYLSTYTIVKHIFGLVYYLSTVRKSPFYIRCNTYGHQCFVLFCSKVMYTMPMEKIQFVKIGYHFIQIFTFVQHTLD